MFFSFGFLFIFACVSSCFTLEIVKKYPASCATRDCTVWAENQTYSCSIYNNTECKVFDFSNWTSVEPTILTTENDAPFVVDVISYILDDENISISKSPSFNIMVTSYSSDITGFWWTLSEMCGTFNSCRIFDFRNSSLPIKTPFSFSYKCYKMLDLGGCHHYSLKVKSLPSNKEFMYQINVPKINQLKNDNDYLQNTVNPCKINTTTIMINLGSLNENVVRIKIQKAAEVWNVSQYEVCLISKSENQDNVIKNEILIAENSKSRSNKMIFKEFPNVNKGSYYVTVMPILPNKFQKCNKSSSQIFHIHKSISK
ncbi:uncharacterized protein LOC111641783 [Centruroides sculpturatus]|uniref:uncharacterized protein LOC111641783 n=1 Tax=Centruroides sculpturatus TaxID=218467 RepID=UPI000C6DDC6B|nr:uncharacterized protein LOC111641783 [Centruroides sculpturatus]